MKMMHTYIHKLLNSTNDYKFEIQRKIIIIWMIEFENQKLTTVPNGCP